MQILDGLEVGEAVLLNPLPFTDSAAASFQQVPPTPEGAAPPIYDTQTPRRGEIPGGMGTGLRGDGRGGMPQFDLNNLTEEQRQQYEQMMQQRGGARGMGRGGGMPEGGFGGRGGRGGGMSEGGFGGGASGMQDGTERNDY